MLLFWNKGLLFTPGLTAIHTVPRKFAIPLRLISLGYKKGKAVIVGGILKHLQKCMLLIQINLGRI